MFLILIVTVMVLCYAYKKREQFDIAEGPNNLLLSDNKGNFGAVHFPKGMIMWWYGDGTLQNIPQGWALCDGKNGTPDLRGRFVLGANPNAAKNSFTVREYNTTGGSETKAVTLTAENLPPHTHTYKTGTFYAACEGSSETVTNDNLDRVNTTETTGGSPPAPFSVTTVPPYYALAYIMKL